MQYREDLKQNLNRDASNRLLYLDDYELKIQSYLDASYGQCFLKNAKIANIVNEAFRKYDGQWYVLHAHTIMPNHIHILISLNGAKALHEIVGNWKGSSAFLANKALNRTGTFWQREYFERPIRSERQFEYTIRYIYRNPVKAGLCKEIFEWQWSKSSPEVQFLIKRFFV